MDEQEDMDLLTSWRKGDRVAGDVLIRRYYGFVLRYARARSRTEDDAVDIAQHSMMIVAQKRDLIEHSFRAYLRRVVHFSCLAKAKSRLHTFVVIDELEDDRKGAASQLALRAEEKQMVKALRKLRIEDQLLLWCGFVDDATKKEIATLLDIDGDVYSRVHSAKHRLRKILEQFQGADGGSSAIGGLESWIASLYEIAPTAEG